MGLTSTPRINVNICIVNVAATFIQCVDPFYINIIVFDEGCPPIKTYIRIRKCIFG